MNGGAFRWTDARGLLVPHVVRLRKVAMLGFEEIFGPNQTREGMERTWEEIRAVLLDASDAFALADLRMTVNLHKDREGTHEPESV